MENNNRKQTTDNIGQSSPAIEDPPREKVDFEIREIIRAYPEDYQRILDGLAAFTSQFD